MDFNDFKEELQKLNQNLTSIASSLRIVARSHAEERLAGLFSSAEEQTAYELANGETSLREASAIANFSHEKMRQLWNSLALKGLLEISGESNQKTYKARFNLEQLTMVHAFNSQAKGKHDGPGIN